MLISDAWSQVSKSGGVRIFMKQSIIHSEYLFFCFNALSHYCSSYPSSKSLKLNGKTYNQLTFNTRTLPCFKELYKDFYNENNKKIVPLN
jgi:hypothetical protein